MEKTFFLDIPDLDRVVMGWEEMGGIGGEGLGLSMLGFGIEEITGATFVAIGEEGIVVRVVGSGKWVCGLGLGKKAGAVFMEGGGPKTDGKWIGFGSGWTSGVFVVGLNEGVGIGMGPKTEELSHG